MDNIYKVVLKVYLTKILLTLVVWIASAVVGTYLWNNILVHKAEGFGPVTHLQFAGLQLLAGILFGLSNRVIMK